MFQIRLHGRGGQGVVSAAEMLAQAAFDEGLHAQAFPSFGSERMGAPVAAFCRLDQREIRLREPIEEPDCLIIQDPTLLHQPELLSGLQSGGFVLVNSTRSVSELKLDLIFPQIPIENIYTIGATEIALKLVGRPIPNAVLLGAFAAVVGKLHLESVLEAIREKFPGAVGEKNCAAATEAYNLIKEGTRA